MAIRMREFIVIALAALCVLGVRADVQIATVTVGNPGNAGEWSGGTYDGQQVDRICGAVDYVYDIGKYEVTAGQYTEFLNAVARTDPYDLYFEGMWSNAWGCKIKRSGGWGNYSYSVSSYNANRPVNYVGWGDAARFCNWLHNGQPTGAQALDATEDGAYFLNGAKRDYELSNVMRESDATWVIPSEDEWYKAAYHKNDGVTGNYFDYPTSSDSAPSADLIDPDPGNNATFGGYSYTIDFPPTQVGIHENSMSPYGTYDQGGNVEEWTEAIINIDDRILRGGNFVWNYDVIHASYRYFGNLTGESFARGFRVAFIPEPRTLTLLVMAGLTVIHRR
jgi:sulfatase modifying factor 1